MRETPLFSVIAVCCNVAPYAERMIGSIRAQGYAGFECLAVVEESDDGTERVIRKAIGDDPRFRVVTLPRSGSASASRNWGIDHARGGYLLFVDGDDWIEPDALEGFATLLAAHPKLDLIAGGSYDYRQQADGVPVRSGGHVQGTPGARFGSGVAFLESVDFADRWIPATWMNLYRRELLHGNGLYQASGRLHQDDEWTYRVFLKAGAVAVAPFRHYDYRIHAASVTHAPGPKTMYDRAENVKSACRFFEADAGASFLPSFSACAVPAAELFGEAAPEARPAGGLPPGAAGLPRHEGAVPFLLPHRPCGGRCAALVHSADVSGAEKGLFPAVGIFLPFLAQPVPAAVPEWFGGEGGAPCRINVRCSASSSRSTTPPNGWRRVLNRCWRRLRRISN